MQPLHLVAYFFGGAFVTNAVPHWVSGVTGRPFQSPFAKPPGKGLSSATVNVVWAAVNFIVAWLLVEGGGTFDLRSLADALPFGAGVLGMSLMHARLFGPLHGGDLPHEG